MKSTFLFPLFLLLSSLGLGAQEIPQLNLVRGSGDQVSIDWPTVPGQGYQLQRSSTLDPASWETVRPFEEATGLPMSFSESNGASTAFYRLDVTKVKPLITKVAIMGDSVTAQGSRNLYHLTAIGHFCWARVFGGSRWELAKNTVDNTFAFVISGRRSFEISAAYLQHIIDADPDVCILAYGTNDAAQLSSVEAYRNQLISDWAALRNAGIHPVSVTVPPIGTVGNHALRQARVAELNAVLRQEAAAHQVPLCDWTIFMEADPGSDNGVGLNSYFYNNDDYHPAQYPASRMGRALHQTLEENFRFGLDPWQNTNWITPNVALAGSNGQPSTGSWHVFPPAGATVESKTLVPSAEGNWWQLAISRGSSTGNFYVNCFGANLGGSPEGSTVEAIVEIEVISGSLAGTFISVGSTLATDMFAAGGVGAQIVPEDGIVVLKTPPVELAAGTTQVVTAMGFRTNDEAATFRLRRCGIRKVGP